MLNVDEKIRKADKNVLEDEFFLKYGLLSLAWYEIKEYIDIICDINRYRDTLKESSQRMMVIPLYKKVCLAYQNSIKRSG